MRPPIQWLILLTPARSSTGVVASSVISKASLSPPGYRASLEAMDVASDTGITLNELQLAARTHALPLETLRDPITPIGLQYLLIHFDIPDIDAAAWRLRVGGLVDRPL